MTVLRSLFIWLTGGFLFFFAVLFFLVCTFLFKPETYDPWLKAIARVLFRVMGIRVTVSGLEHIDTNRTHLYMGNHVSLLDVPLLQGYIPQMMRGVEAERQFKWPIYGWFVRRAGNIPINRDDVSKAIPSARAAAEKLREGLSMVILPEGHRTRDGKLRPFKKLPFYLAKDGGQPIVPIGLSGLFHVKPRDRWTIIPGNVHIAFGPPVDADTIASMTVEELRDHVRDRIRKLIREP